MALSPRRDGIFSIFQQMTLKSVYYLAGELDIHEDPAVDFPAEARDLFDLTMDPRKIDISAGTADHRTGLLTRDSLNIALESWFPGKLPLQ